MISQNPRLSANTKREHSIEETVREELRMDDTIAGETPREQEAEITRLTWAVLDGKATIAERTRLAELVNAQHQTRGMSNRA